MPDQMPDDVWAGDYEATRVQYSRRHRLGLWGCWSFKTGGYIAFGSKGKMGQLTRILNDSDVSSKA